VQVATTSCASCHDNTLVSGAANTHNGCSSCHDANGSLVSLAVGKTFAAGGDCATCHGGNVQTVHFSCTTCHGEPPNGSSAPNTTGAHGAHDVLGFGSTSPSCAACHNGAAHYNSNTEVGILSGFDDKDWGSPSFNGSTCSKLSCHGGQTTPSWSTGSLNVDTQCRSCHNDRTRGSDQYNDYYSGEHDKHVRGANIACTECHSVNKLATGHFSNLETTSFEQSPGTTIGGSDTSLPDGSWNDTWNTCSINCHNEYHSSERW
jgi:predicted CxxxxCH...CXXCH cytochrome family protein